MSRFSQIIINSPWYYFAMCIAAGFALSAWLYYRNKKTNEVPVKALYTLFILRFVSTTLLFFLLLNILFKQNSFETENPVILIGIDNSSSMVSGDDSVYVKKEFLKNLEKFRSQVAEKFNVKTILFGNKTRISKSQPDFSDKETDLQALIQDVENSYSNQNIGALIIASDGIYNKGANPLYSSDKLGYPVYTIALGDTSEFKDVLIRKVNHNQIAYAGNDFPVEVLVDAKKFRGKDVEVTIFENGIQKAKAAVKITSDNFSGAGNFTLNAGSPGVVRYSAKVTELQGEKNRANNSVSFVMEIINNKEKILLLANAPHPDISAIKEVLLSNPAYDTEIAMAQTFHQSIKPYSLVILHGFSSEMTTLLNECKNNQVPFWIIHPLTTENLPGVKISASMNRYNDAEPVVSSTFRLFAISKELRDLTNNLPAVKTFFGTINLFNSANSLINQRIGSVETETPLLLFSDLNGIKCGAFLGDGLWKWKMRDFAENKNNTLFNELIGKSVQYLSVKSDKSFFRVLSPAITSENESVEFEAEVYNKSYEPVTEPEVTLVLTDSARKKFNYTFSKSLGSYRLNIGMLPPGEYKYEAKVNANSEVMVKRGTIAVKEVFSEKMNTVANHRLLYQISNRSNGKLFYPGELEKLQNEISNSEHIKPLTYSQSVTSTLADLKLLFFLALILFAFEWFIRKRFLTI